MTDTPESFVKRVLPDSFLLEYGPDFAKRLRVRKTEGRNPLIPERGGGVMATANKPLWEKIYDSWGTATEAEQIAMLPALSPSQLDCLRQLATPCSDGYVISKQIRSELVRMELVERWNGLNFCNRNGYALLDKLHLLPEECVGGSPRQYGERSRKPK